MPVWRNSRGVWDGVNWADLCRTLFSQWGAYPVSYTCKILLLCLLCIGLASGEIGQKSLALIFTHAGFRVWEVCGVKGNKGVYLIKDEEHSPIYAQWRYEAVCLLLLQTILAFANNSGLLRRMPSGCMYLLRAKLQVGVKHLCVWSSLLHKTKQNNSMDKQHRERENLWHAWSHSDTSVSGTCSIFQNKCAGRVPGGALVATHPFSPVPVAVPVAVLVCHVCQPLPAPYGFSNLLLSEPVCPLSDGTRCPWCYYPRTLPGRARGRFPPITVISNGQPGEREWEKERGGGWTKPLSPFFLSTLCSCPWQRAAKVRRLYFRLFYALREQKNRNKWPVSNMHKREEKKKSHKQKKQKTKHICRSFYFQAPHLEN